MVVLNLLLVYAVDEWSGGRDLVTALLADPLASNTLEEERLQKRWKDQSQELGALTIE